MEYPSRCALSIPSAVNKFRASLANWEMLKERVPAGVSPMPLLSKAMTLNRSERGSVNARVHSSLTAPRPMMRRSGWPSPKTW
jgi:hypothetical protein